RGPLASNAVISRVAVLVSGSGTNLQALLDDPVVGPTIRLVVSDRPGAYALLRAQERGVRTKVVAPEPPEPRETGSTYDRDLLAALHDERIEAVLLAGFMRIVGAELLEAFPQRVLNVHPALLPAFPGMHAEH